MTPQEVQVALRAIQEEVRVREQRQAEIPEYRNSVRQLFEQVAGKVEHVISELLQNADDSGAKNAKISFEAGVFQFQHDGDDFSASQFQALCSFSVSDKHTIKTTGFRGIGFKSTFSLGDSVELLTPRFRVRFNRARFTYPEWISDKTSDQNWPITIRIETKEAAAAELALSMQTWSNAPSSLLFFGNLGRGSIIFGVDTFRVTPEGNKRAILKNEKIVWSGEVLSQAGVAIPPEAKAEIALLRASPNDESILKDTQIDLLIRKEERGRVYSVLPTSGAKRLGLSFAVNGPFVLRPDRDGITSPSQSPTNRFLFEEIGRFVSRHLLASLSKRTDKIDDIVHDYDLLPFGCDLSKPDAETAATSLAVKSCEDALAGKQWILTADNKTVALGGQTLVMLPKKFFAVWPVETLRDIFCPKAVILHPAMPAAVVKHLKDKKAISEPEPAELLQVLGTKTIPRPSDINSLFSLWSWCANAVGTIGYSSEPFAKIWSQLQIVPAEGSSNLRPLGSVFRLEKEITIAFATHGIPLDRFDTYLLDTEFVPVGSLELQNPPTDWWRLIDAAKLDRPMAAATLLQRVIEKLSTPAPSGFVVQDILKSIWAIHVEFDVPISKDLPILRSNGEKASLQKRQLLVTDAPLEVATLALPVAFSLSHALAETWYPTEPSDRIAFNGWLISKGQAAYFPKPKAVNSGLTSRYVVSQFAATHQSVLVENRNGNYLYQDYVFDDGLEAYWL